MVFGFSVFFEFDLFWNGEEKDGMRERGEEGERENERARVREQEWESENDRARARESTCDSYWLHVINLNSVFSKIIATSGETTQN